MARNRSIRPEAAPPIGGRQLARLKKSVEWEYARLLGYGPSREADIWRHVTRQLVEHDNVAPYDAVKRLNKTPVPIAEFLENTDFVGNLIDLYPAVSVDLRRINPDVLVGEAPVYEVILGGAIGTGKTTTAIITTLYQLYLLTCFEEPQRLFGLAASTRLVFAVQSITPEVTHTAIFEPLRDLIEEMPYAQRHWKWNLGKRRILEFENGIKIVPVVASVRATAGQAVIGAIQDEANLMAIVERSKRVAGPTGLGGRFDQAQELHRHHSRRRKSRFITQGFSIGTLCVIGSANYQGDFIDRRMEEVERLGEENVVVIRHSQFEVVPQDRFCGKTFRLQVGNAHYPTRVLDDEEPAVEDLQVEQVPVEYKVDFQRDPENALRDIVGIASSVIRPFIALKNKIMDASLAGRELGLRQWVDRPNFDLAIDGYPRWIEAAMPEDRDKPRYIHVDLSLTRDRCGIAVVKMAGMVNRVDPRNPDHVETLPQFIVECAFTLQPSPMAELDFAEVCSFLMQLKTCYSFNVRQVSFDGYQSRGSIQFHRKAGIRSEELSVDRTPEPYDHLRRALYQDRVAMVENELLMLELSQLEVNERNGKIDHPPKGSKDLTDAVAGAVFAASQDRRTRAQIGPVDREGRSPRKSRRNPRRRHDLPRGNKERRPGRQRRRSAIEIVMEERMAAYRALCARQDAAAE